MSDTITPALTPEQWATSPDPAWPHHDHTSTTYKLGDGVAVTTWDDGSLTIADPRDRYRAPEVARESRHGLAALALYGQPGGFTHEDVEWLDAFEESCHTPESRAWLTGFRARIAALLPQQ